MLTEHLTRTFAVPAMMAATLLTPRVSHAQHDTASNAAVLQHAVAAALDIVTTQKVSSFAPDVEVSWTPVSLHAAREHLFLIRSTLTGELDGSAEFEALKSFIELRFPDINERDIRHFDWAPDAGVIDRATLNRVLSEVRTFLTKIKGMTPLALTLHVATRPQGATIAIMPVLGTRRHETLTDGTFVNLYRGLYGYSIRKDGFDSIEGELDLVDDSRDQLVCVLSQGPRTVPGGGACLREKQEAPK